MPILHVHGDNDAIVPLDRNSGLLIERYRQLGGPGMLITVSGKGHEVIDAFFKSQMLLDFFLSKGKTR